MRRLPHDFPLDPPLPQYTQKYFEEMVILIQRHFELISGTVNRMQVTGDLPTGHGETHEPGEDDEIEGVAWTDVANTFTEDQTIGKTNPRLGLNDSSQAADARLFRLVNSGGVFGLYALNDAANTVQGTPLSCTRSGDVTVGSDLVVTDTIKERGRSTPLGEWNTGSPSSSVSGVTGTIAWSMVGKTMHLIISGTYGGAGTPAVIDVAIPGSFNAAITGVHMPLVYYNGASWLSGVLYFLNSTTVELYTSSGNWANGWIFGTTISFPVS